MRIFSSKRRVALAAMAAVVGVALVPVVHAAVQFGPARPTFTWANPADHITFNSITNNPDPSIGDERTFVSARDAASSDRLTYSKNLSVHDNEEVIVRVFYHNDASANLNLVATNTKVRVLLPSGASTAPQVAAYISADNASPSMVWSTMDFNAGGQPFTMVYEPGTAQLTNQAQNGTTLSDNVAAGGALIGFNAIDGRIPGCSEFSGYVTIKARIHVQTPAPQPQFACTELGVTQIDRTRFDFTAHATAQNANVQSYVFTTSNSSGATVDTTTVNTNALSAVYHFNQSTVGTYTVSAVVHTDKGNTEQSSVCTKQVTVSAKPVVKAAVTTKTLPNTGPGEVAGLFAGASSIGAALHYAVRRRR